MQTETPVLSQENLSIKEKIERLQKKFSMLDIPAEKYHLIIEFGKKLPPFDPKYKTEYYLVTGCQSQLYIHAALREGKIFFSGGTDALISAGLAALLIEAYSGETLETILMTPPHFLQELGIYSSLSPNRAQGLVHIYQKMKQLAILLLYSKKTTHD